MPALLSWAGLGPQHSLARLWRGLATAPETFRGDRKDPSYVSPQSGAHQDCAWGYERPQESPPHLPVPLFHGPPLELSALSSLWPSGGAEE